MRKDSPGRWDEARLGTALREMAAAEPAGLEGPAGPDDPAGPLDGPADPAGSLTGPADPAGSLTGPADLAGSLTGPADRAGSLAEPLPDPGRIWYRAAAAAELDRLEELHRRARRAAAPALAGQVAGLALAAAVLAGTAAANLQGIAAWLHGLLHLPAALPGLGIAPAWVLAAGCALLGLAAALRPGRAS